MAQGPRWRNLRAATGVNCGTIGSFDTICASGFFSSLKIQRVFRYSVLAESVHKTARVALSQFDAGLGVLWR